MNREIKFRGKRVDNGEWVCGYLLITQMSGVFIIGTNMEAKKGNQVGVVLHDKLWQYEVDPATIGQYTGRKVKTGEVYQDDVGKSIDGLFLVVWDVEKAAFMMQFLDYPNECLYLEEMWDDAQIIGNIHDNSELVVNIE